MINPPNRSTALILLGIFFCVLLTGCNETIDVRQLETINGLRYKLHEHEPFTGTVINYRQISTLTNCTVELKKGQLDGSYVCLNRKGFTVIDATYKEDLKHGVEEIRDDQKGYLYSTTGWKNGRRHGLEERYNPNGDLIEQAHWFNGKKDGDDKQWDIEGKILLRHYNWVDGKATGFCKCYNVEETYVDGKLHGVQRFFQVQMYKSREDFDKKHDAWKRLNETGEFWYALAENVYVTIEKVYEHGDIISEKSFEDPSKPKVNPNNLPLHDDNSDESDYSDF